MRGCVPWLWVLGPDLLGDDDELVRVPVNEHEAEAEGGEAEGDRRNCGMSSR